MVVWCLLALVLSLIPSAWAARSTAADQPVALKLDTAQPTAVALPEPISSVTVGLDGERLSADYDGPYLYLIPRDSTVSGRLFVTGHSGKLYIVTFKVGSPADDVVHLTTAAPTTKAPPFTVASFLRSLKAGTALPGTQPVDVPPPAIPDERLSLTGVQALGLGVTSGLVLTLRNTSAQALALDLRIGESAPESPGVVALARWTFPPRLSIKAVAADDEVLGPGGSTRVYLILERRS